MLIKVCGLTRLADVDVCIALGVDAIGVNMWPRSSRYVEPAAARSIAAHVAGRARVVMIFVDAPTDEIARLRRETSIAWAQLHGDESDDAVRASSPCAYKAVRLEGADTVGRARAIPGDEILVDAYVPGVAGGSGARADWSLAARVAAERPTWLAGGLTPANVREAIDAVGPIGVDVASGVESAPGVKDPRKLEAFVRAARG